MRRSKKVWLSIGLLVVTLACSPIAVVAESVTAVVPTPPPSNPPVITAPLTGVSVAQKNLIVRGECEAGLIVKLFSSVVFGGSIICGQDNTFEVSIDVQEGQNILVARQYDALNQPSPDSDTVIVYYVPPVAQPTLPGETPADDVQVAKFALKIDYDSTLRSPFAGQAFRLPIRFVGGAPPYAVNVDWGDDRTTLVSREDASQFVAEHIYEKAGSYVVQVRISDHEDQTAFLQFVLIVNGSLDNVLVKTPFGNVQTAVTMGTLTFAVAAVSIPSIGVGILIARFLWKLHFLKLK